MHPSPAHASCSAVVLLLTLLSSSSPTVHAIDTNSSSSPSSCAPAVCGELNVTYPFWLAGAHTPDCGYRAFEVTCDKGHATLGNSFWTYRVLDIFYQNASFRVAHDEVFHKEEFTRCWFELKFNGSSDLGLAPFTISSRNQELVFLYNCTKPPPPRSPSSSSYSPINCSGSSASTYVSLSGKYEPDDRWKVTPGIVCNVSLMPVVGLEGASAAEYERLMKGGFLLEYAADDSCAACQDSGGRCRTNVTADEFGCQCSHGVHPVACGELANGSCLIPFSPSCIWILLFLRFALPPS